MSGVADAVGDAFDSVTDAIGDAVSSVGDFVSDIGLKKILPMALAAGAAVFTGGAALGLAPLAGGWGAAASSAVSQLGATGILGNTLTGAITQAGYGALTGGAISAVSGGDIMQGVQTGGLGGALSGGVMGGLGMATDPLAGIGQSGEQAAQTSLAGPVDSFAAGSGPNELLQGASIAPEATGAAAGGAGTSGGSGGLLSGVLGEGGWVERNQGLVGGVVKGLGQGLLGSSEADARKEEMEMRRQMAQDERDWIASNYEGTDPGSSYRQASRGQSDQTPTERWDAMVHGGGEYVYDQRQGRIVYQPRQRQQRTG